MSITQKNVMQLINLLKFHLHNTEIANNNLNLNNTHLLKLINHVLKSNYKNVLDINFKNKDTIINLTVFLIKNGVSIEEISEVLDWVEFEYLVKEILEYHGFDVKVHFRFKKNKKRYEIDLLAERGNLILAIDVKHWSPRPGKKTSLKKYVLKQAERVEALISSLNESKDKLVKIIPLLVTWYEEGINFFNKIPIVPISKLNNFLNNLYQYELREYLF
ncbi:MAG: restriction endonuclease [Candidatus Odinarchaeia archaeon]